MIFKNSIQQIWTKAQGECKLVILGSQDRYLEPLNYDDIQLKWLIQTIYETISIVIIWCSFQNKYDK